MFLLSQFVSSNTFNLYLITFKPRNRMVLETTQNKQHVTTTKEWP